MNCQSNRKYPVGNNKKPKHQHRCTLSVNQDLIEPHNTTYMPFVFASFLSGYTTEFLTSVFYNRYIR